MSKSTQQATNRETVLKMIKGHLSEELDVDIGKIAEETRFKQDLDADSLDLVELVMELEDSYGIRISDEEAEKITTVGQAVDFVWDRLKER